MWTGKLEALSCLWCVASWEIVQLSFSTLATTIFTLIPLSHKISHSAGENSAGALLFPRAWQVQCANPQCSTLARFGCISITPRGPVCIPESPGDTDCASPISTTYAKQKGNQAVARLRVVPRTNTFSTKEWFNPITLAWRLELDPTIVHGIRLQATETSGNGKD